MGWEPSSPLIASSSGDNKEAYCGMHREIALNEPMYDRIDEHVLGGWKAANVNKTSSYTNMYIDLKTKNYKC